MTDIFKDLESFLPFFQYDMLRYSVLRQAHLGCNVAPSDTSILLVFKKKSLREIVLLSFS